MELTLKERQKLTRVTAKKYRAAGRREKTAILNTFTEQTGYERKYAIHLLANEGKERLLSVGGRTARLKVTHSARKKRVYKRTYDEAVRAALEAVWMAFSRQCGKLLAVFLHANIDEIARDSDFTMADEVRVKLGRISHGTIDTLLKKARAREKIKGTSGTRPAPSHLKALIPAMSHFECKEQGSGLWQIDLVQHDGGNPSGQFCYTLTVTEIAHCWTAHYPLKNKAFRWVFEALDNALMTLPLPVRILHPDNGSEFINHALAQWCAAHGIRLVRSRNDRKNDNCFVEQKNGATVRKIVGYARFAEEKGVAALAAAYAPYDRLLNFFYPCQKLLSKTRADAKTKKTYDTPQTPFQRVMDDPAVPRALKNRLARLKAQTALMDERRRMQTALDKLPDFAEPVPEFVSSRKLKPLSLRPRT